MSTCFALSFSRCTCSNTDHGAGDVVCNGANLQDEQCFRIQLFQYADRLRIGPHCDQMIGVVQAALAEADFFFIISETVIFSCPHHIPQIIASKSIAKPWIFNPHMFQPISDNFLIIGLYRRSIGAVAESKNC